MRRRDEAEKIAETPNKTMIYSYQLKNVFHSFLGHTSKKDRLNLKSILHIMGWFKLWSNDIGHVIESYFNHIPYLEMFNFFCIPVLIRRSVGKGGWEGKRFLKRWKRAEIPKNTGFFWGVFFHFFGLSTKNWKRKKALYQVNRFLTHTIHAMGRLYSYLYLP